MKRTWVGVLWYLWLESFIDTRRMFDKVNTAMYKALNEANIDLPFPQREVHHKINKDEAEKFIRILREIKE